MKLTAILSSLLAAVVLAGCTSDEEKLATRLEGSWSGAPERFTVNEAATATMTPVYTFELADGNNLGGNVTISAMVSAIMPVNSPTDAVILPFQVTVSAIGTIEGTWKVFDDDDVALNLNFNTLNVNVNPDNLTTADNALTDETVQLFEKNKPAITQSLQTAFRNALETRFMALRSLEDVEIKGDVLEHEMGHVKMYMHRDGVPM